MPKTATYYEDNAQQFFDRTISLDVGTFCELFLKELPSGAHILDLGCGSGRDAKFFLDRGSKVTACDGSQKLASLASAHIGQEVLCLKFEDMEFENQFDGVWANACLLHVPYEDLPLILGKIHKSLKEGGVFYASFKYGDSHRDTGDRDFYDMNEERLSPLLASYFDIKESIKTEDTRKKGTNTVVEHWLNVIAIKK